MRKGLVIVGVILLVIGLLLAVVGMLPGLTAVKAEDIEYDATGGFADYDNGDEVIITGEITEEGEEFGNYVYMLDNKIPVMSGEDIGNEGDTVTLQCEVTSILTVEVMEAKAIYNTVNILMIIGIILLIVGIIVMILGFKGGAAPAPQQPPMEPQYQEPYQQPPPQQPPMPPQ
jgi:uncharacterized membrane protein